MTDWKQVPSGRKRARQAHGTWVFTGRGDRITGRRAGILT